MAGLFTLFRLVVEILGKGKGFFNLLLAITIVAGMGAYAGIEYIDNKHMEVMNKVTENKKDVRQMREMQYETLTTLKVVETTLEIVGESVKDVKKVMDKTSDRVFQILTQRKGKNYGKN